MDRKKFKKEFDETKPGLSPSIIAKRKKTITDSINLSPKIEMHGGYNLVIATEELAELSMEITKSIRGKHDRIGMIEEIADVQIIIEYLKEIFDISNSDIERASQVKINRLRKHLNEDGVMM